MNEKLRVVGGLTRHDVRNKLAIIAGQTYLLKKQIGDIPDLAKRLDKINEAVDAANILFEFSRSYERIGAEKPTSINVEECFNQAAALFPNLAPIKIVNECQGLEVMSDSMLSQLFYNLIDNSLKHGEKVTQIRLYFSKCVDQVKLLYEDDGMGIPEVNKPQIFGNGFTTGKGSGVGLKLIKKLVEVYGWTITEEGEPEKEAKFIIIIPKLDKSKNENYQFVRPESK